MIELMIMCLGCGDRFPDPGAADPIRDYCSRECSERWRGDD